MAAKSEYLQIRLTPVQKRRLKRLAAGAGLDVSSYVLARALPSSQARFEAVLGSLQNGEEDSYALASLNDLLADLGADELRETVAGGDVAHLSPLLQNYVAAMVEHACVEKGIPPPSWARGVVPLETPWFAAALKSLRPHLLRASPVAFKRRNIFIDSTVGTRV